MRPHQTPLAPRASSFKAIARDGDLASENVRRFVDARPLVRFVLFHSMLGMYFVFDAAACLRFVHFLVEFVARHSSDGPVL